MTQSLHKRTDFKNINTYPIFFFYLLKFATMNGQTWKNIKKKNRKFPSLAHQIS